MLVIWINNYYWSICKLSYCITTLHLLLSNTIYTVQGALPSLLEIPLGNRLPICSSKVHIPMMLLLIFLVCRNSLIHCDVSGFLHPISLLCRYIHVCLAHVFQYLHVYVCTCTCTINMHTYLHMYILLLGQKFEVWNSC